MMPQLVSVRWDRRRLHVPVVPAALLLSPLLVAALLAGVVACLVWRVDAPGALRGLGRVLWALPGTEIAIEDGRTTIHIHVR